MKSPPVQIHDDIAHNRVEAFIRGEDNETLVGTENLTKAQLRKLAATAPAPTKAAAKAAAAQVSDGRRGLEAPHKRREQGPRDPREARGRGLRDRDLGRRPRPRLARPLGDRDGHRRPATSPGRRSGTGRTRTSATSSACRRTTRASGAWRSRAYQRVRALPRRGDAPRVAGPRRSPARASSRPTSTTSRRPGRPRPAA